MKSWRIEFAPQTAWPMPYLLVVGMAALIALGALASFAIAQRELVQAQGELAQIQAQWAQRTGRTQKKPTASVPKENLQAVNAIIRQLNLPWDALLEVLETTMPRRVAVLEVNPDAKSRRLRLVAEARNVKDMLAYVQHLRAHDLFESVVLTSHLVNEQDRNRPLHFELVAVWKDLQP